MQIPKDEPISLVAQKPRSPPKVEYESIKELYHQFDDIFLAEKKSLIVSPCGHKIYCFEHHFFHMAGIIVEGIDELSMPDERHTINNTSDGFAHYEVRDKGSRARHLRSARETLENPDEVWTENPRVQSANWVYIKEFDSKPYPFWVALVGKWEANLTIIVPFSSFAVEKKNIKKWTQSKKIYP
jgi:phage-Barnase-EndoU-ColicinE5/D-RelE like nuclease2